MVFSHDTTVSLQASVALVNTAEPPGTLETVADLDAFYERFDYTGAHDRDHAELAAVRTLRAPLRQLLLSERDACVDLVNATLATRQAVPRLVRHDGWDWHVHATRPGDPLPDRIAVETAMAMLDVIRAGENSRFSVCEDDGCSGVVLDLSRNRSRRYCSTTCANRNAVAAYRARNADQQ